MDKTLDHMTDAQLVKSAAEGRNDALEELISRYMKYVYSGAHHYLHDDQDAQDVTQEVFVKVWKNLKKIDTERPLKPWIATIVKRTCLDFLKKKSLVAFSEIDGDAEDAWLIESVQDSEPSPHEQAKKHELAEELASGVKRLSPEHAEVVKLYHDQDLNFRQIAERTDSSLNTIKSRYRRAMISLKKILKKRNSEK